MKTRNQILLGLPVVLFFSCETKTESEVTNPETVVENQLSLSDVTSSPFEDISLEPIHIAINNEVGGSFKFTGGSKLVVPENAFVDLDGNLIEGKVDLYLKEFNNLADILYHGVNMKYDSAGVTHDFVSAGMFHLSGKHNDQEIKVSDEKSLTFSSSTDIEDTPCYNFYEMDEDNSWNYISTKKAEPNPDYKEVEKLKKPQETAKNDLVFELDFVGKGKLYSQYDNLLWKYAGNREDTIKKNWLRSITADNTRIVKTNEHQLSYELVTSLKGKDYILPVEPVLSDDDYEKALSEFNATMKSINKDAEAMKVMQEGKFIRTIQIPNFGMYNWDVIHMSEREQLVADIELEEGPSPELCNYFLVSKSDNSIVKYRYEDLGQFSYNPNVDNHLIVTVPGNKIGLLKSKSFFNQLNSQNDSDKVVFKMEMLATKIEGSNDLQNIIETL